MSKFGLISFGKSSIQIVDGDRGANYPNKSELLSNGHCVFLNAGNVTKKGFEFKNVEFIDEEKDKKLRKGKVKVGDIVLTTRGTVGNVAYVSEVIPYKNMRINSGMVVVRAKPEKFDSYFLFVFFRSDMFKKQCISHGSGSAQPQLPISAFRHISFPDLHINTQREIAATVRVLDDKIELNNRINAELEAMAKALYDYWFVQFDFPDINGKPYKTSGGKMAYNKILKREIPEGWLAVSVGEIVDIKTGKEDANFATKDGKYHFFTCGEAELRCDEYVFEGKAVILAGNGSFCVKKYEGKFNAYQRNYVLIAKDESLFSPLYFAVNDKVETLTSGSRGSIVKFITKGDVEDIYLPLPKDKNIRFSRILNSYLSKSSLLNEQNLELIQLRDWLLPMLMNGQVKVN